MEYFPEDLMIAQLVVLVKPVGSLLYSQEFTTGPCSDLTHLSHMHLPICLRCSLALASCTCLCAKTVCFFQVF